MSLVLVKDLDWNDDGVVHGEDDDEVVPILYEFAAAFKDDLLSLLGLILCLLA